jgi:hypothetical protein
MSTLAAEDRFHSLDALRAFALLLGVFFHAAESFEAGHRAWAIIDADPSTVLHVFRQASHSFRMEVFFLLCGFFARLLYHRRGWRGFARNRFSRIFVPFVVGWVILYPLLVFIWLWGATKSGNWEFIGIPPEARQLPPWKLTVGFFLTGGMFQKFDLTHLWFLHQLLVLYLVALPLRALLLRCTPTGLWARVDTWFGRLMQTRWRLPLLAALTVPVLLTMHSWDVDTPKSSLWPYPPTTLLYLGFFTCGWFLHRQPALMGQFTAGWHLALAVGVLLVFSTRSLGGWAWQQTLQGAALVGIRVLYAMLYALTMWAFVGGFTGLFVARCPGASRFWRYVADASYWVYLAHLPTVVALQVALAYVPLPWVVKYPLILGVAIPVLFASYHLLVRSTFLGRQLNGRAYAFHWPWRKPTTAGSTL